MRNKKVQLPPGTSLTGLVDRGRTSVLHGGKPPKLRFRPGQYVEFDGQLYEVMYAYRLKENPHEWIFCLEERKDLSGSMDEIGQIAESLGCGSLTPKIVYDLFHSWAQAAEFFFDIPANGDRANVTNKSLLQRGRLISSGAILGTKE